MGPQFVMKPQTPSKFQHENNTSLTYVFDRGFEFVDKESSK